MSLRPIYFARFLLLEETPHTGNLSLILGASTFGIAFVLQARLATPWDAHIGSHEAIS